MPSLLCPFTPRPPSEQTHQAHEGRQDRGGAPERLVVRKQVTGDTEASQRQNEREDLSSALDPMIVCLGSTLQTVIVRLLLFRHPDHLTGKSTLDFVVATQNPRRRNRTAMRLKDIRLLGPIGVRRSCRAGRRHFGGSSGSRRHGSLCGTLLWFNHRGPAEHCLGRLVGVAPKPGLISALLLIRARQQQSGLGSLRIGALHRRPQIAPHGAPMPSQSSRTGRADIPGTAQGTCPVDRSGHASEKRRLPRAKAPSLDDFGADRLLPARP